MAGSGLLRRAASVGIRALLTTGAIALGLATGATPAAANGTAPVLHPENVLANGASYPLSAGAIMHSADGAYTGFRTTASLATADTNGGTDYYVKQRATGTFELATVTSAGSPIAASQLGNEPRMSLDGRKVVFSASGLITADSPSTDSRIYLYLRDLDADTTTLVSRDNAGNPLHVATSGLFGLDVTTDAGFIMFSTFIPGFVPEDTDAESDVFVRNMATGVNTLASIRVNGTSTGSASAGSVSDDGNLVVFLGNRNFSGGQDNHVFLRRIADGTTTRVSGGAAGYGYLSPTGTHALYTQNLGTPAQLHRLDLATMASTFLGFYAGSALVLGSEPMTHDGRYLTYAANPLDPLTAGASGFQVFVRDLVGGTTVQASVKPDGTQPNGTSDAPTISGDGSVLSFRTQASDLVSGQNTADLHLSTSATSYFDGIPPSIEGHPDRAPNVNGWYDAPVTVSWTVTDPAPSSGAPSVPAPVTISAEGITNGVLSGPSCDPAGNCATGTYSPPIRIDTTPPVLTAAVNGPLGDNGYYTGPVTVSWGCSDATSGVSSCPEPVTVATDGPTTLTRSIGDLAFNQAAASITVQLDQAPPTITASVTGTAWSNQPVTIHFTCADESSGIADCPGEIIVMEEGTTTVTGTATDGSGASSTIQVTVNYDGTNPTVGASPVTPANGAGWYNTPVLVRYTCADGLSGVATCSPDQTLHGDGPAIPYSGSAVDVAGNVSTVSGTVAIDETDPEITAAADRGPDHGIWYRAPVDVAFTCTDATSGVATCPTALHVTQQGNGVIAAGVAVDVAGNTRNATLTVPMDSVAPAGTITLSTEPNASGWHAGPVDVSFTCTDATSGVEQCPEARTITTAGTTTITATVSDKAGNSTTLTRVVRIDASGPIVTITTDGPEGDNGWYSGPVTARFTCSDNPAGVASCPADQVVSADGVHTVAGTAIDEAGNTTTTSLQIKVDQTGPTIAATVTPSPNGAGWNKAPATVHYSCEDATSGVASCPSDQTITAEGITSVSATATDGAGNTASTTTVLKVDRTAPGGTIATALLGNTVISLSSPLRGSATDALSGVSTVVVRYTRGSFTTTRAAVVTCDALRRSCIWSSTPPAGLVGLYSASATITDIAGNTYTTSPVAVIALLN